MEGTSWSGFHLSVESLLDSIRDGIVSLTGPSLVGLYVFGSAATGDFEPGVSDIDLLAVLAKSPDERLADELSLMHADLVRNYPQWDDRIEVAYISRYGLAHCRTETTTIGIISPGEPFHLVEAGRDWILNWYPARQNGLRLLGLPIDTVIPPIRIAAG